MSTPKCAAPKAVRGGSRRAAARAEGIEREDLHRWARACSRTRRRCASQTGLTLLEFTLIVILVSILVVIGLQRMVDLRINIERAAVERTVQAMQAGLALKFAELAVQGELDRAHEWEGGNPFELLVGQEILEPADLANVREIEAADIGPGTWSYDEASGEVVYRVRYADALGGAAREGRWRVVVIGAHDHENGTARPGGLTLEQIRAIDWPA
jgi:hypothetical protein